ncbi:hypothetical protein [Novosphingobium sp. P6W]|uniref:hypothetical protein n=1 Tax=Novosphingobium sp. P6W TaxID=1609758 RepID=UPI0013B3D656|nr:hypothetical protein [Novosphingobium sp. P6W]
MESTRGYAAIERLTTNPLKRLLKASHRRLSGGRWPDAAFAFASVTRMEIQLKGSAPAQNENAHDMPIYLQAEQTAAILKRA